MRFLIQRVKSARVTTDSGQIGTIGHGLVILIGIGFQDTSDVIIRMVEKAVNLRIFEDQDGKMNLSLLDLNRQVPGSAAILAVSQFTLYADCRKGRRPSFTDSAPPDTASPVFEEVVEAFRETGVDVETGAFGEHMVVSLENDGPVTIWLDSSDLIPGMR